MGTKCGICSAALPQTCESCRRQAKNGKRDNVVKAWYCEQCWEQFHGWNEGLRLEIPALWFVEGGQRWAWAEDGITESGYIAFGRGGYLEASWGSGTWKAVGDVMV